MRNVCFPFKSACSEEYEVSFLKSDLIWRSYDFLQIGRNRNLRNDISKTKIVSEKRFSLKVFEFRMLSKSVKTTFGPPIWNIRGASRPGPPGGALRGVHPPPPSQMSPSE